MLTLTDLSSGVPKQHVFLHAPSCQELDWDHLDLRGLPHVTGLAEE